MSSPNQQDRRTLPTRAAPSSLQQMSVENGGDACAEIERERDDALQLVQRLQEDLVASRAQEAALARKIEEKDEVVRELKGTVALLRGPMRVEQDTVSDVESVIRSLERISWKVEELSAGIVEDFVSKHRVRVFNQRMELKTIASIRDTTGNVGWVSLAEQLSDAGRTVGDHMTFGTRAVLVSVLWMDIFNKYKPGLEGYEDEFVEQTCREVRMSEPQEIWSKWRSVLLRHVYKNSAPDRTVFTRTVATMISKNLVEFFTPFFPLVRRSFLNRWEAEFSTLALNCLHWHEMTTLRILECDYRPIVHNQTAKNSSADRIVTPCGFGLVQRKIVTVEGDKEGKVVEEEVLLVEIPAIRAKDL